MIIIHSVRPLVKFCRSRQFFQKDLNSAGMPSTPDALLLGDVLMTSLHSLVRVDLFWLWSPAIIAGLVIGCIAGFVKKLSKNSFPSLKLIVAVRPSEFFNVCSTARIIEQSVLWKFKKWFVNQLNRQLAQSSKLVDFAHISYDVTAFLTFTYNTTQNLARQPYIE